MSLLLTKEDIIFREPEEGDYVMYYVYNARKRKQTQVGIVNKIMVGTNRLLITGTEMTAHHVLFVLTHEGYMKQKRGANLSLTL